MKFSLLAAAAALVLGAPAFAQPSPGPQPTPLPAPIPAPRDIPYPGVIKLEVDATDTVRRIVRVKQVIPIAEPGRVTLLYPAWLPGNHAPRGPIEKVAGLSVKADGRPVAWRRDTVDVYAFHVDPPAGARQLEVEFQFLSPTAPNQGRVVVTPEMMNLQWNALALYPAGWFTRRIAFETTLKLPPGWSYAAALDAAQAQENLIRFQPVDFETLVDSPLFAGRYARLYDLDPGGKIPVRLHVVADRPEELAATPAIVEIHRNLVRQADRLFGSRPFDRYEFLLAITDRLGSIGLEHHRSSENQVEPGYFIDWNSAQADRNLLPHEYAHAWVGKYRRPADLWTPDFNVPMRGQLLWVYEGQDQYWGYVLGGRSGFLSVAQSLEALASTAAVYETRAGRRWRAVEDTTQDPVINDRRPQPWLSWQRSEDYYSEGQLVWLDADTLIRERSRGRRSLDDFARAFFGGKDGDRTPRAFTFDDVVAALNAVEPYDWAGFLKARLQDVAPRPPLDGLTRGGWKLVYAEAPTDYFRSVETFYKRTDLSYSLGLVVGREGEVTGVLWDSPAFDAGLTVSTRILAVDGFALHPRPAEGRGHGRQGRRADPAHRAQRRTLRRGVDRLPRRPPLPAARAHPRNPDLLTAIYSPK